MCRISWFGHFLPAAIYTCRSCSPAPILRYQSVDFVCKHWIMVRSFGRKATSNVLFNSFFFVGFCSKWTTKPDTTILVSTSHIVPKQCTRFIELFVWVTGTTTTITTRNGNKNYLANKIAMFIFCLIGAEKITEKNYCLIVLPYKPCTLTVRGI